MKIDCQANGIYIKPENFQDQLYLATQYLDLIDNYGYGDTPSNMELWCKSNDVSGSAESLFRFVGGDIPPVDDVADSVTWMFIGRGAL